MRRLILGVVLTLYFPLTSVASEADSRYIAELFSSQEQANLAYADITRINPALDDKFLYAIQREFVALKREQGAQIGGFKGGFIPKASVGGVLFKRGIISGSPTIRSSEYQKLLVEAEIGFRLCTRVEKKFESVAALKAATCAVFPAIELPDAAVPDLDDLLKDRPRLRRLLIATNMAVANVLIGAPMKPDAIDLNRLDVSVRHDGSQIGFRDGESSSDDIWSRVLWTINEYVIDQAYALEPHHIIIPGALTGLHPGKLGTYDIDYGALGRIHFTVE